MINDKNLCCDSRVHDCIGLRKLRLFMSTSYLTPFSRFADELLADGNVDVLALRASSSEKSCHDVPSGKNLPHEPALNTTMVPNV